MCACCLCSHDLVQAALKPRLSHGLCVTMNHKYTMAVQKKKKKKKKTLT